MLRYGKMVQTAVSVVSRLVELDSADAIPVSSLEIAKNRGIPQTAVAKILTILSQNGIITGSPGPRGGYCLARRPEKISLFDIVTIFERAADEQPCPMGPHSCGSGEPCALHHQFAKLRRQNETFLKNTNFGVFRRTS